MNVRQTSIVLAASALAFGLGVGTVQLADQDSQPVANINVVGDFAKIIRAPGEFMTLPGLPGVAHKTAVTDEGDTLSAVIGPTSVVGAWAEFATRDDVLQALSCNLPGIDCYYPPENGPLVAVDRVTAITDRPGMFRVHLADGRKVFVLESSIDEVRIGGAR